MSSVIGYSNSQQDNLQGIISDLEVTAGKLNLLMNIIFDTFAFYDKNGRQVDRTSFIFPVTPGPPS